ncbi:helix-turn-helix transcriptional regulator [Nocardia sp. NPDC051030]|uniref:helix-turn-helix transcriptional regulator n=1 Tax=Nocardia sp. NPDC051030 TaxID=3155162 RepID=UPI003439435A
MTRSARRTELAAFLRSRRARVTPADVGIPPGLRRRLPGLRREEVAHLAGVSITWYTWLEQGRPINVGSQILDAIARTLRLDDAERDHLYRLAEVPLIPVTADADRITPTVQSILDSITGFPAAALNSRWDLLGWNASCAALWPRLTASDSSGNVLREMFETPECCRSFVNRDTGLPHMVASFRAAFAHHLQDPAWTTLIHELSSTSPEFAHLWSTHDVAAPPTQTMTYRHPATGDLSFTLTRLDLSAIPETFITIWTPVDDESRARMTRLLTHPEAPSPDHTHHPHPTDVVAENW